MSPEQVDALFTDITSQSPGCAVGVTDRGRTLMERSYGVASLEHGVPNGMGTVFGAASVTKQFTAFAVGLLVAEGRASWDDDIRRFVPELPDYGAKITLRQLASHVSGLRDPGDLFALAGVTNESPVSEREALNMLFRQRVLNFPPGAQYQYSNANYMLLKLVAERVSGTGLKELAAKRIFAPLGMTATHIQDGRWQVISARAFPYHRAGDGMWRLALPMWETWGPTGLLTTVGDLLRWQRNIATPTVGGAVLQEMMTPSHLRAGEVLPYGLGLDLLDESGVRAVGHTGGDDGVSTSSFLYPAYGLATVVLCNRTDGDAPGRARAVANLYLAGALGGRSGALPEIRGVPVPAQQLMQYAGIYRNPLTNDIRKVSFQDGHLIYARGAGSELVPLSAQRFRFAKSFTEIEFRPSMERGHWEMRVIPIGQASIPYLREVPFAPTAAALQQYVGRYVSDEINATYVVAARKGTLYVTDTRGESFAVEPAFRDAFVSGDFLMRFTHDDAGRVVGFLANQVRVRNLRFGKLSSALPRSPQRTGNSR